MIPGLIIALICIAGCAGMPRPVLPSFIDPFSNLPKRHEIQAREHERRGELRRALRSWEIVARARKDHKTAARRIAALRKEIAGRSRMHLKAGIASYANGMTERARREFLLCLSYDPENATALNYLHNKMQEAVVTEYVTKRGDTLQSIARHHYNDLRGEVLVVSFNDLTPQADVKPGTVLLIPAGTALPFMAPKAEPGSTAEAAVDLDELLGTAVALFERGQYEPAMSVTQEVLAHDITHKKAHQFLDLLEAEAEKHYRQGVKYFIEEKIAQSINEWNIALILHPDHENARTNIDMARKLLKKLEERGHIVNSK